MNNKIKKPILFVLLILLSFIFLYQTSVAKYRKRVTIENDLQIAKWNIILNEEDIHNQETLTETIEPKFVDDPHIKNGVIAPSSVGYVDLVIDATNVDVDFSYIINAELGEGNSITDLKVTKYIINPAENNEATNVTPPIVGNILKNTPNTTVRVFFTWDDGENNLMDNAEDTNIAIDELSKALINVSITFVQKKA